jgi:predicted transcriptional regulator
MKLLVDEIKINVDYDIMLDIIVQLVHLVLIERKENNNKLMAQITIVSRPV